MTDWTSSMVHEFEYYEVDPTSWMDKRRLPMILSCSITRDIEKETLGSASFESHERFNETYIRTYFCPTQDGIRDKIPLGTHLVQTPGKKWNGMVNSYSLSAYTPLLELKDNKPPVGYTVRKNNNIMDTVSQLIVDNSRLPLVPTKDSTVLEYDYSASGQDTWLSFISGLMAKANHSFDLDELGIIYFQKKMEIAALQPRWTYDDGNSSIIYPDISFEEDYYGVPNVCEVTYTNDGVNMSCTVTNDLKDSPISTVTRGRIVFHREENPDFGGTPTEPQLQAYTENLLQDLSTINSVLTYSHGYTPVRLYDGVRLDHKRADIRGAKAQVTSQQLDCTVGLKVSETAKFTNRLWEVS